jgi:molecular chaperone DnaK
MLKEAGEKISEAERKEVEEKIEALKKVKDGDDHSAIKQAADELSLTAQKVGAKMYSKQQTADSSKQSAENKDGPMDAEFKEKPDDANGSGSV